MFFFLLCMFLLQFECVCTPNTAITRSGIAFFFGGGGGLEELRRSEPSRVRRYPCAYADHSAVVAMTISFTTYLFVPKLQLEGKPGQMEKSL